MKKLITLFLVALMAITACFGLTACKETDSSIVNPRSNNIVVGYTVYKPMNYSENNVLKGFDTELALMTFEALGYNVRFKLITWENKYVELNEGTIDCIWNGFTSNGEDDGTPRNQLVDFTYNYMQNAQCILRKASASNVTDPAQFDGSSIAFENGSAGDSLANSYKTDTVNINLTGVASQMDAITRLNNGLCDYAIVDILLAQAILEESTYAGLAINEGINIDAEYYAVGFKKNSPLTEKVNDAFEFFAETGYLQALALKYNLQTSVLTNFD